MGNLNNIIAEYAGKNPIRFHMPGHKGQKIGISLDYSTDVTELFFTDNLYSPDVNSRLILDLEERISKCFFKDTATNQIVSYISCGGATLGIQGALLSLIRNYKNKSGEKLYIICDRNSHISFINALALLDINPLWVVYPDENFAERIGYFNRNYRNTIGVFVTSPDYFGGMKNIPEISRECKKYELALVVDNSHGSHLAFYEDGCLHPVNCGADISVDSLHKTLPALTGAAVIHANKNYAGCGSIRESLKIFASTSPSFLILQSIENMVDYLENYGQPEHARLIADINLFKQRATESGLNIIPETGIRDPYRIVLTSENMGEKLYYYLFESNIVCEFFDKDNAIIIPSILNPSEDFDVLLDVLKKFSRIYPVKSCQSSKKYNFTVNPKTVMSLNSATKFPRETVPAEKSLNRVSAESVFAYPPGVPIVLPGEIIDREIYDILKEMKSEIDVIL
ncbi:MAG: hypothetical protein FWD71_01895 [Oscillospiraceae bacterium]|nr:hypothetical protein [Oscillospiraceae bacterium]